MRQRADVDWKRWLLKCGRIATIAAAMGGTVAALAASSGGPYAIESSVIAAGGTTLAGGAFRLDGTVGQVAAARLSGSGFSLNTGFWAPQGTAPDRIFSDGFDP